MKPSSAAGASERSRPAGSAARTTADIVDCRRVSIGLSTGRARHGRGADAHLEGDCADRTVGRTLYPDRRVREPDHTQKWDEHAPAFCIGPEAQVGVTDGKTRSEYMFSELSPIADIRR